MSGKICSATKLCLTILLAGAPLVFASFRYYSEYLPYGSGDTIVQLFHSHGGSKHHNRKWIAECLDGEAMVGIQDFNDDFEKLQTFWCRFMFPNKPASQGVYPYYPSCHVRDYKKEFFCFEPQNASQTMNTFMTALWDNESNFYVFRPGTNIFGDDLQPYKCCKTPDGYYIDYVSCYYMPTHDVYFEYYDSPFNHIVMCSTGFVMTGISKKKNPYTPDIMVEWIQCCRLGYGPPTAVSSPVSYSPTGMPSYSAISQPVSVTAGYQSQYRSLDSGDVGADFEEENAVHLNNSRDSTWNFRYKKQPIPKKLTRSSSSRSSSAGIHLDAHFHNSR